MAARTGAPLSFRASARASALILLAAARVWGAEILPIEVAIARTRQNPEPVLAGREVTVRGTVSMPATRILDYVLLAIQDETDHGVMLDVPDDRLASLTPGDRIEVTGIVATRAGFPVIKPESIRALSKNNAPASLPVRARDLCGSRYQGTLISTAARVVEIAENAAGETLQLRDGRCLLQVFSPQTVFAAASSFSHLNGGDRVRITGVAMQYAPTPQNRRYQILVASSSAVVLLERGWPVPPYILLIILLAVIGVIGVWWMRLRRLARLRQIVRTFAEAGESVLAAGSASGILTRLSRQLISATAVSGVRIYHLNPAAKTLDSVSWDGEPARHSYLLEGDDGFLATALRSSFRNRTLLIFRDTARSPDNGEKNGGPLPRALMLVPLLRHGEIAGVLQLDYSAETRSFSSEEQFAAQHLGNLVANALERIEQQAVRERIFRTEKLAAVGQLISSVATDLKQPLDAIFRAAGESPETPGVAADALATIRRESARAAELVTRLVTIAQTEQPEAKEVDLRALLDTISTYRHLNWETEGLNLRVRLPAEPVSVLGSATQLEQVFLNLLTRAQQEAAMSHEKSLSLALTATGRRVLVEIGFSHDQEEDPDWENSDDGRGHDPDLLGFGVLRGIVQSHGGAIRVVRAAANYTRFEIEMAPYRGGPAPDSMVAEPTLQAARPLTLLVLEPDEMVRRDLIHYLSARRHRAVPVSSIEEGREVAFRLGFDGAFCAIRVSGSHWLQFHESVKSRLDFFVLLTEGYDETVTWSSSECEGFVLRKPLNAEEVGKLLETLETRGTNKLRPEVHHE